MFCHKCGIQLAEKARFCQACGTPVVSLSERNLVDTKKERVQKNHKNSSGSAMLKVFILVLVVVVGFFKVQNIVGYFDVGGADSSSSSGYSVSVGKHREPKKVLDCLTCGGNGDCPDCNGYGTQENYAGAGDYVTSVCSTCHGSRTCRACGGSGKR